MALIGQAVSEEKIFENGGRRTDGRTTELGYTISSPCEPDGSGELKKSSLNRWTDFNETWYLASIMVCINHDLVLTLTYFTARSVLVMWSFQWGNVKTLDLGSFGACDLNVGRYRQLIEFMKLCEYSRARSFLGQTSFTY